MPSGAKNLNEKEQVARTEYTRKKCKQTGEDSIVNFYLLKIISNCMQSWGQEYFFLQNRQKIHFFARLLAVTAKLAKIQN